MVEQTDILTRLESYVPLFQTLIWAILIVIGGIIFFKQIRQLFETFRIRIAKGSSVKAGPIEIGEDLRSLEYMSPIEDNIKTKEENSNKPDCEWVTERTDIYQKQRGVFLTHVISPSRKYGQKYDIFIYLYRHKTKDLSDINHAEFFFGHMWGDRVFKEKEKNGIIGVSTSAYGPFLCTCRVHFKDGTIIRLNRYIDFEMGRVF